MAKTTKIADISKEINRMMKAYKKDVTESLDKSKVEIAKQGVKRLKEVSPVETGDYRRGWRRKKNREGQIIYNKDEYRLTHLLEYGHAKRGGGRVSGQPHIKKVEIQLEDEFREILTKELNR